MDAIFLVTQHTQRGAISIFSDSTAIFLTHCLFKHSDCLRLLTVIIPMEMLSEAALSLAHQLCLY